MRNLTHTLHTALLRSRSWVAGLSLRARISFIVVIALTLIALFRMLTSAGAPVVESEPTARTVRIESVSELSQNDTPLILLGTVTSRNEATIRAESGGRLVSVYKRVGDYVGAGSVIAEFENASEKAGVLQAQGAYESALAGKAIASISTDSSDTSLAEVKNTALNAITSAYGGMDDVIRTKTDPAWINPQTREAKLRVTIADAKLIIALESRRPEIEKMLREREARNKVVTENDDVLAELDAIDREVLIIREYLDDMALALSRSIADNNANTGAIEGYKASVALARGTIGGVQSSVSAARSALSASLYGNRIAKEQSGVAPTGASDAVVKSALGQLRGAEARLEKTIIRSPISGTINSLPVTTGDFVAPYSEIAVVANNGTLEVIGYITEEERSEIAIGAPVRILGAEAGVVTRMLDALDPRTKKLEVRIGLTSGVKSLVNGQSVEIAVARRKSVGTGIGSIPSLPLAAVKQTPNGAMVFTVDEVGVLVAHPVSTGRLRGKVIEIVEGVTPEMRIVTDARGLKEGITVTVQ